jgi:alanine dehydrogenase
LPLYLSEDDVQGLISAGEAVPVIEACFQRMAAGSVENVPRRRLELDNGAFAVMSAVDRELGYAGLKAYTAVAGNVVFVVCLFELRSGTLAAVIEADALGQRRTGAASGVAAKHLARPGARSLGIIGCGWQAESQVAAIRAAVPTVERVVAYCRTPERLSDFCSKTDAEPGKSHRDAAEQDIVVTATTSPDPVLRGEWLRDGALVCAVGANRPRARELDNVVLERAAFVCCDSRANSQLESGDLIEPVEGGVLDWLEVHELQQVVSGELPGRQSDADIVLFKSNGLAAWDVAIGVAAVERARESGVGRAGGRAAGRRGGSGRSGPRGSRPGRVPGRAHG